MKRAILVLGYLLITACSPQTDSQAPGAADTLIPYQTKTPSLTPENPAGLVVSFETPLPTSTAFAYEVQLGDTLSQIAEKFGVSLDDLRTTNPNISPNSMSVGTELKIPSNPSNPTGASTSTPVPATVKQIECYPTADKGMWCFVLVHNDTLNVIENLSAQVTLVDVEGQSLASAQAISPLNILPVAASLPLIVFFPPEIPPNARTQTQILTGIQLLSDDPRYLPAIVHNTLAQIDGSRRNAKVSGTIRLPDNSNPANLIWVAAVVYDRSGRVVGVRRWESTAEITPGASLPFSFEVSSLAGEIERVEFVVEARP
ncbi:MAG: LysM peptidoglycan-binding domain-containing protein [Anaerolineae bacterium]|nr:LysM peptidoglycan-binding domain-containing protein [Anaerolineae bacterium]